ncbi:MAG: heavy metal translocating P-type ATPase [Anaerovoracaceae bacterium]
MKEKFNVTGMSCGACSANINKKIGAMDGVWEVNVNLLKNSMVVEYDESKVSVDDIINQVTKIGYGASLVNGEVGAGSNGGFETGQAKGSAANEAEEEAASVKKRLTWSIVLLVPLMYITMGNMVGLPLPGFLSGLENSVSFALTQMLIALPIMYLNRKFYQVGFKALINRVPNMDSLVAVGSASAFIYGLFAIYRMSYGLGNGNMDLVMQYHHDLYFESAAMILALITVGKYLEARSKGKTSKAIEKLIDLTPDKAIILVEGIEKEIATNQIKIGDVVVVKQGNRIPVDGILVSGSGLVDESAITGESVPVSKTLGDRVTSGTIFQSGYMTFEADKVGEDTTLSQIIKLVEEAASSKAPISKLADKVAGIFVPVVMGIALVTFVIWMFMGQNFEFALARAITVLVISCPCALGLATPTAIMVGTGYGATHGILIKSAESLELLGKVKTVVFDKTGTLTLGKPVVTDFLVESSDILSHICALEKKSEHPLSLAIVAYGEEQNVILPKVDSFEAVPGQGIRGTIKGRNYLVGNEKMIEANKLEWAGFAQKLEELAKEGKTVLFVAVDGKVLGLIAVADEIKETSKQAISELSKIGVDSVMLTGDNRITADAVAAKLGITKVISEVLPQDKESHVRQLGEIGAVAMVGDGINDAPALTRADVGIAVSAGTDIAIEAADVVLVKNQVLDGVSAIKLSRAVIKNIKENLFWAFFYNVLGIPVAAGVLYPAFGITLNPMIGAAAMSVSSLFVVGNALRLRFFDDKIVRTEPAMAIDHGSAKGDLANEVDCQCQVDLNKEEIKMKKIMTVDGMMCKHCQANVEKAIAAVGAKADVNLETKKVEISMDREIKDDVLAEAITDAGYQVLDIK